MEDPKQPKRLWVEPIMEGPYDLVSPVGDISKLEELLQPADKKKPSQLPPTSGKMPGSLYCQAHGPDYRAPN